MTKIGADDHEKVLLPMHKEKEPVFDFKLEELMVLENDPDYASKYELYSRKNKLKDLIEEYYRKKGYKNTEKKQKELTLWVKLERCDATLANLDKAHEVLQDYYSRFIGFVEGCTGEERNVNEILDIRTLADTKGADEQIDTLLKTFRVENLLLMNRLYFYCWKNTHLNSDTNAVLQEPGIENHGGVNFKDYERDVSASIGSNNFNRQTYLLLAFLDLEGGSLAEEKGIQARGEVKKSYIKKTDLLRLLNLSGVKDLFGKKDIKRDIVDRLFSNESLDSLNRVEETEELLGESMTVRSEYQNLQNLSKFETMEKAQLVKRALAFKEFRKIANLMFK